MISLKRRNLKETSTDQVEAFGSAMANPEDGERPSGRTGREGNSDRESREVSKFGELFSRDEFRASLSSKFPPNYI